MASVEWSRHGRVALLLLDNPPVNAFGPAFPGELLAVVDDVRASGAGAVVVASNGPHFAAGADLRLLTESGPDEIARWNGELSEAIHSLATIDRPVVAALTGAAMGGGFELALAADVRIAEEAARMSLPEVKVGILPGAGGMQRLSRLVGTARAKELIMTGAELTASEAHRLGVVNRVVRAGARDAALELAEQLACGPSYAITSIKRAVDDGWSLTLADALEADRRLVRSVVEHPDREIGMRAFLDKDPVGPVFGVGR